MISTFVRAVGPRAVGLLSTVRRRPALAWALALAFWLATPFPPAEWAINVAAQTTTTQTTVTTAVTDSQQFVILASGTNVVVGSVLYMDREAMIVRDATSTTIPQVRRGMLGTIAFPHPASAAVFVATPTTVSSVFRDFDKVGACTATNEPFLPQVNVLSGNRQTCTASPGVWTWPQPYNPNLSVPTNTGGGLPIVIGCGATTGNANCGNSNPLGTARVYMGDATLAASSAIITFPTAYTSTATYTCVGNDLTTRANPVQMASTSTTTATITNTTGATDVIRWMCVGY